LLDAAVEEAPVADREALAEYATEAAKRTPMAIVFRSDVARLQARRPFEDDPAALELARWATAGSFFTALRDGWLGLAPPLDRERPSLRVVGRADWVKSLSPEFELRPVSRKLLDSLQGGTSVAVAMHDLGGFIATALDEITVHGIDYATESDVPESEDRVELFPLLERLQGDAALGRGPGDGSLTVRIDAAQDGLLAQDVGDALALVRATARVTQDDGHVVAQVTRDARGLPGDFADERDRLGEQAPYRAALAAAGVPPTPPVAWFWHKGGGCTGPAGGWVSWDGEEHLTISADVLLDTPAAGCEPQEALLADPIPELFPSGGRR